MPPPIDGCAGSLPSQPLTCGSDRSTGTRVTQIHTMAPPAPAGTPTAHAGLPPLPPPPFPYSEPSTPRSAAFASPRSLTLAPLSLASPRPQAPGSAPPALPSDASMRTPRSPPMLSPHSPRSPSMMSPLRMVGTRSPCSMRITGTSVRLCADGTIQQTPTRPAATATALGRASQENAGRAGDGNGGKRPHVSRVLPFSQPTASAQAAAAARAAPDLQRFSAPLPLGCRELSFSDLLNPKHPSMPPLVITPPAPAPVRVPQGSPYAAATASLPASPLAQGGSPTAGDGAATPRKRPRKSSAPQRADFGGDAAGDSSAGETSGNGAVAMTWEEDAHPGQTSPTNAKYVKR